MGLNALAFLAGIVLLQQLPTLPDSRWSLLLAILIPLAFISRQAQTLCVFIIGFLWSLFRADLLLSQQLPATLESQDVLVDGIVASIPEPQSRGLRFAFAPKQLFFQGQTWIVPNRIRLSWYQELPGELKVGDHWQLVVRLKRPRGFMNPGGFDYESWLFRHGFRATGYVRPGADNRLIASHWYHRPLDRLRQHLLEGIIDALPQNSYRGLILALTLGERQEISPQQWQTLQRTGTNHLVAISGLHIGLLSGLIYMLGRRLWSLRPYNTLRLPAPQAAAIGAIFSALFYAALAGFSIPTQRALIMVTIVMLAIIVKRPAFAPRTLALALIAVLLWDPLATLAAGFWLSFGAVGVLMLGSAGHHFLPDPQAAGRKALLFHLGSLGRQWGYAQWTVAVGLAPFLLYQFQRLSLVAPFTNLIAIPWMGFLIVPLVLLGTLLLIPFPLLGVLCLNIAAHFLDWLWIFLTRCAALPLAQWEQHTPPLWGLVTAVLGILLLITPRGLPGRWLGLIGLLPLFLIPFPRPAPGALWFTLLDVGQGLAAVARTRYHTLVFDTGPRYSEQFNAGEAVVAPFLRSQGVDHIDTLIVSHGDNDHLGGAAGLLDQIPAKQILTSAPERISWMQPEPCLRGQHWQWDGIEFQILHPPSIRERGNNDSCVLRITRGEQRILLTADIEQAAEQVLLIMDTDELSATILVVPHHGSLTSSSPAFAAAVKPEHALFPVGYLNRWGFPKPAVVQRYLAQGAQLWDTAQHGALTFHLGESPLGQPVSFRQHHRHYWTAD